MDRREQQAERIRRARTQHGKAGRGNPYPAWLRGEAIEYARVRAADGSSAAEISRELSLPGPTLARWGKAATGRFVPVMVEPAAAPVARATVVVHGPCGLRVEGLDLASLAALLRELS